MEHFIQGRLILDVRTPGEFEDGHIAGSINVPHNEVAARIDEIVEAAAGREVAVLCKMGPRAVKAQEVLAARTDLTTVLVEGGTTAWSAAGLPLERPEGAAPAAAAAGNSGGAMRMVAILLIAVATMLAFDRLREGTPDPEEVRQAQRERAAGARDALFTTLLGELNGALEAGNAGAAVTVCSQRAPAIAAEVSEDHSLRIGRTSARLRNPNNRAPEWAAGHVAAGTPEPFELLGPEGEFHALYPILAAPVCLRCHGDPEELDLEVQAALAENYPGDQATGYAGGDLRGWFWVEVPPGS